MPFGPLLTLARLVGPRLGRREAEIGDLHTARGRLDLGIAPDIADQYDFVDASFCHY